MESPERKLEKAQDDIGIDPHDYVSAVLAEDTVFVRLLVEWITTTLGFIAFYDVLESCMNCRMEPGGQSDSGRTGRSLFSSGFGMRGGEGPSGAGGGGGGAGSIFNVGESNATVLNAENDKVEITFKYVVGLTKAKKEITRFVQYLKKPDIYKELGAKIRIGVLMHETPVTRIKPLAKASAG